MQTESFSKEFILREIRRVTIESGGKPPGKAKFSALTGIKGYFLEGCYWARWSEAIKEAGFEPNTFQTAYPTDYLLECLAKLTQELGKLPTKPDLLFAWRNKASFPAPNTFYDRLGLTADLINRLAEWVENKPEFSEVALIVAAQKSPISVRKDPVLPSPQSLGQMLLSDSYIPPVIQCLPSLARAETGIVDECHKLGRDENVEFEKRVATAFRILGFSVEELGQGSGRVADGIAKCVEGNWAIIYDAKVRTGGYKMLTEDRKFKEYIDRHGESLRGQGITKVYFAVISSAFSGNDLEKVLEITRMTTAKSCILLEANALIGLVEKKLSQSDAFNWSDIERCFVMSGILTAEDISVKLAAKNFRKTNR